MRLSEAIALGSLTMEKWKAGYLDGCALGMAANAVGCQRDYDRLVEKWPWIGGTQRMMLCPVSSCQHVGYGKNSDSVMNLPICTNVMACMIAHIFDYHVMKNDWKLEQLVDWVRSIEPAETNEQPEPAISPCEAKVDVKVESCD
jgi:hypothetical protein